MSVLTTSARAAAGSPVGELLQQQPDVNISSSHHTPALDTGRLLEIPTRR